MPLDCSIRALVAERTGQTLTGPIRLLTHCRYFGYVFNPVCFWFCHDREGRVRAILAEVSNTFGERHDYVLPAAARDDGLVVQGCDKTFYVSPFLPMDLRYAFTIAPPGRTQALDFANVPSPPTSSTTSSGDGDSRSVIRPTIKGCEIVLPAAIGSVS